MTQDNEHKQRQSEAAPAAEEELVVLSIAVAIAYFHVTDAPRQAGERDALGELLPLVAMALSAVAPIRRADGTPLSEAEVDELLFRRKAGGAASASTLAQLRIRRGELDKAMAILKEARVAFGRTP
jgi:hypothetical protein